MVRFLLLAVAAGQVLPAQEVKLLGVHRIWGQAPHNAFTDLIYHDERFYCVFREGSRHVSPDGKLRVLVSVDGMKWESAALIESPDGDLRDAKISVTPDSRLMLSGAVAYPEGSPARHQSLVWFSRDGREWTAATTVADPDFWLWRVSWFKDTALGVAYQTLPDQRGVRLYAAGPDAKFRAIVDNLGIEGYPNESAIRFTPDGTAYCLLRRDPWKGAPGASANGLLGTSKPPYRDWTWKDLGRRIGGPEFQILDGGKAIAVVRLYDGQQRTSICRLDLENATIDELERLPSSGDSSYAGIVVQGNALWVSYYSSHEGKTAIYVARGQVER